MTTDDIKRKLAAMLRLAKDQAATPAEAAAAAAKAQQLADKHRLDLAAVMSEAERKEVIGFDYFMKNKADWRRILWARIAACNGCLCVWTGSRLKLRVFGHPRDIEITGYLATYLERLTDEMSTAAYREEAPLRRYWDRTNPRTFKRSWCIGATTAIGESLNYKGRQTVDRRPTDEQTYGLVPIHAIRSVRDAEFPSLGRLRTASVKDASAYQAGYDAGKTIQIHRGLAGTQRYLNGG